MTVRERIIAIRLIEKQEKNSEYMKKIGVRISIAGKALPAESEE